MGNRRKLRDYAKGKRSNRFREKREQPLNQKGLMQVAGRLFAPDDRAFMPPTADEMFETGLTPEEQSKMWKLSAKGVVPASAEPVIKVVDARALGKRVGDAFIHEDAQVSLVFDADAPEDAMKAIQAASGQVGYSLETGTPDGPA